MGTEEASVLDHAPAHMRGDREFMLKVVRRNAAALEHAAPELLSDRKFVLDAVVAHEDAAHFAPQEFYNEYENPEGLMAKQRANRHEGLKLLTTFSSDIGDKEILKSQMSQLTTPKHSVDISPRDDGIVSQDTLTDDPAQLGTMDTSDDDMWMESDEGQSSQAQSGHTLDREEILRRVRSDASAMRRAESHLLCCQQFVLEAARLNVAAVQYSPLGDDHTFMLFLVERMAEALSHASEALRADWHFVMNCVVRNPLSLSFAPSRFRRDRAFLLGVVKRCPMAFTFAPEELRTDKQFVLRAIKANPAVLRHASPSEQTPEFVMAAVGVRSDALLHASEDMRSEPGFVGAVCRQNPSALQFAGDSLRKDWHFVLALAKQDFNALRFADASLRDVPAFVSAVRKHHPVAARSPSRRN